MNELKLTEEQARAAYNAAKTDETREILKALFPCLEESQEKRKPTLDDYTTISSYEDACEALGIPPVLSDDYVRRQTATQGDVTFLINGWVRTDADSQKTLDTLPGHIVALMKLETISRALWGREWKPEPCPGVDTACYHPYMYLWSDDEVKDIGDLETRRRLIRVSPATGKPYWFGCLDAGKRAACSAVFSYRLYQETEEKAMYFGGPDFVSLWVEYLQFHFTAGDFYTGGDSR